MKSIVLFVLLSSQIIGQSFEFGMGFESNLLYYIQSSDLVKVPYLNPHKPDIGLLFNFSGGFNFSKAISIQGRPLIGFYRSRSEVTSSYSLNVFGARLGTNIDSKRVFAFLGYEYNNLLGFIGSFNGVKVDWTHDARTYNRNLQGIRAEVGINMGQKLKLYSGVSYFLTSFHDHGALDYDGNVVGPIQLTPKLFSLGLRYNWFMNLNGDTNRKIFGEL